MRLQVEFEIVIGLQTAATKSQKYRVCHWQRRTKLLCVLVGSSIVPLG
jgi:hypothetical protein